MSEDVRADRGGWISGPSIGFNDLESPTVEEVREHFPGWTVYRGTDQRWHARETDASPPVDVLNGDTLLEISDEIVMWIRKREAGIL